MISIILIGMLLFLGIYTLIDIITDYIDQYYYLSYQNTIMELIDSIQNNKPDPFAKMMQIIFNAIRLCGFTILDINAYRNQVNHDLELSEETLRQLEEIDYDSEGILGDEPTSSDQCESDEEILEQLYSD